MSNIVFVPEARDEYQEWVAENNRQVLKKIRALVADILRNGHEGIGKPEPLTGDLSGWWSRRITDEHRLIYKVEDGDIVVAKCRRHYNYFGGKDAQRIVSTPSLSLQEGKTNEKATIFCTYPRIDTDVNDKGGLCRRLAVHVDGGRVIQGVRWLLSR